jgi:hypothetical protein
MSNDLRITRLAYIEQAFDYNAIDIVHRRFINIFMNL